MFNGPSPIAYPSQNQGRNYNSNYNWNMPNPQEVELMMKQKFNQGNFNQNGYAQNQQMISDPYQDFQALMSNCSPNIRYKIMHDEEYIKCDNECESLIKQAIEEVMIPQIIATPNGRIAFENFLGVARKLRDKYAQEEVNANQQFQQLMQDEVVQKRIKELAQQSQNQKPVQNQQPTRNMDKNSDMGPDASNLGQNQNNFVSINENSNTLDFGGNNHAY